MARPRYANPNLRKVNITFKVLPHYRDTTCRYRGMKGDIFKLGYDGWFEHDKKVGFVIRNIEKKFAFFEKEIKNLGDLLEKKDKKIIELQKVIDEEAESEGRKQIEEEKPTPPQKKLAKKKEVKEDSFQKRVEKYRKKLGVKRKMLQ